MWENRWEGYNGSQATITLDGTDFMIPEQYPFHPMWWSHKFNGPGLRYEIGVCIQTGHIVWVNGPFPCGAWPDLRIARSWIITEMAPGEMMVADGGYNDGGYYFLTPTGLNRPLDHMRQAGRSRHEVVNALFKDWAILKQVFRHKISMHYDVLMSIAGLIQFQLKFGILQTFDVEYVDPPTHHNDIEDAENIDPEA